MSAFKAKIYRIQMVDSCCFPLTKYKKPSYGQLRRNDGQLRRNYVQLRRHRELKKWEKTQNKLLNLQLVVSALDFFQKVEQVVLKTLFTFEQ